MKQITTGAIVFILTAIMFISYMANSKGEHLNATLCAYSKYATLEYVISNNILHCRSSSDSFQKLNKPKAIDYTIKKESVMVAITKKTAKE